MERNINIYLNLNLNLNPNQVRKFGKAKTFNIHYVVNLVIKDFLRSSKKFPFITFIIALCSNLIERRIQNLYLNHNKKIDLP